MVARSLLLVLLLLAACGPAPASLRVMTWNVLTARYDPADWAPVIAAQRPDVVGLQEICAAEAVELAALLRARGLDYTAVPGPVVPTPAEDAAPVNAALRRPCGDRGPVTYGLAASPASPSSRRRRRCSRPTAVTSSAATSASTSAGSSS